MTPSKVVRGQHGMTPSEVMESGDHGRRVGMTHSEEVVVRDQSGMTSCEAVIQGEHERVGMTTSEVVGSGMMAGEVVRGRHRRTPGEIARGHRRMTSGEIIVVRGHHHRIMPGEVVRGRQHRMSSGEQEYNRPTHYRRHRRRRRHRQLKLDGTALPDRGRGRP
jgi:hypothetical protein